NPVLPRERTGAYTGPIDVGYGRYGDTFDPTFHYMMTAAETALLTGGFKVWTEEELIYAVSAGLLKEVSDTTTTIEAPNIIGANVKLVVPHGAVGAPSGTVDIDVASLRLPPATGSMTLAGHTITLASGTWAAMGFKAGQQVFIEGSDANSGPRLISAVSGNA